MKKHFTNLRIALVGFLVCLMSMSMMAQTNPRVTLDFTTNDWGLPTDYITTDSTFTNGDYSITLAGGTSGSGYKFITNNSGNYLIFGKNNATLTLPAFDFAVEKIEIVGNGQASANTTQNIFVGDIPVSDETTNAKLTHEYLINENYQAAGNIYTIKVTNGYNTQITYIKVYEAGADEPVVIEPTWVSCEQVGIFNTQVDGLVPTCSVVGDSTVYHFSYTSDFTQYPYQTPNQDWGADGNKIYVDVAVSRPNTDVTGVKVAYSATNQQIITFGNVLDPNNGTLGADRYAALRYFPVATVVDGLPVGNSVERNWTVTYEWYTDTTLVAIQKLNVIVDAAPVPEPFVPDTSWVSCEKVGIFNTQVDGLVPTCETIGDSTVYRFSYTEDFVQYPYQTPNQDWGADGSKIYVDVAVSRPNDEVTGVMVSFGPGTEHVVTFGNVLDPNNGTLGAPRYAALRYFPVATVVDGVPVGNSVDRNWTVTYEWYTDTTLVAVQTLNVVVDAAPVPEPVLPYDTVAELPYINNFDEGTDPFFVIDNDENTNAWYIGQAQGFEDNKLYISSNNGTTNKYDITAASNVIAYRDVMIPEAGAILSFDYRVNGENSYDYLQVSLEHGNEATPIAQLSGENEWNTFSYDISGEMAGVVRVKFQWVNNASAGNQFPAAIDNIAVIETPCSQPIALTATVDSTNAVISWVAAEGQTAWTFQYKLADHSEWYTMNVTEATSVTLSDLQGNSNYDMRVQAICGEYTSAWTTGTFAVACQTEIIIAEQEDIVIGTGTSASTTTCIFPGYYGWQYGAHLYEMENTNAKHTIHSIAFYLNAAVSTTGSTMTVWVKAVDGDYALAASNTFNGMLEGAQQIYDGAPDFSTAGWMTFPVNDFSLAEGQNLLVLVKGVGCSTSGGCSKSARYTSATNKMWYKRQDTNDPGQEVAGSLGSYRANITINATISTCSDVIACATPSNLTVDTVTANSAELTWTAGDENQTAFIVEYMAEGATGWTSLDVNDTTYTLTDLAQLTNYFVKVKAVCGTNNWSDVITTSFRTVGICPPVTNLETSNVSNTTTLTWEPGGEESAWLVQFKPASEGDDAWTSINVSLIPMTTFGGLVGNVDYDVRVKALCDPENEENQSEWTSTSFHSGCAAFEIPFVEEFPTNTMPVCWENQDFHFSTSGYAYSYSNGAELITPAINIPAENPTYLTFEVRGAGEYTVLASYRGTRADRFETIYTGIAPQYNETIIVPLDDLYKGRAVNFKFVNNSSSYQYIYNVNVNQCPFEVASFNSTGYTGTTVDLAWEADETLTSFQIQYGEQGFNLGEGTNVDVTDTTATTISGLNYETTYDFYIRIVCAGDNGVWNGPVTQTTAPACSDPEITTYTFVNGALMLWWTPGEWGTPSQYNVRYKTNEDEDYIYETVTPVTGVDPFITISGLSSNTTYEVGVQSYCGENMESNWVSIEVTTPCLPLAIPYTQEFDGGVFPPECWSQEVVEGTQDWYNYSNTAYYPYYEFNEARLITPAFDLTSYTSTGVVLSYSHAQPQWQGMSDQLSVYYRTSSNGAWTLLEDYTEPIDSWVDEEIALPAAALTSYCQFAFYAKGLDGNSIYLDNVTIKPAPSCGTPTVSLTGTTATITASAFGTPASYELLLNETTSQIVTAGTGTTIVDLSTVFSLESNTNYTLSVRTICSTEDNSEWTDAISFTTPCMPLTEIPYIQDFEGGVFPPECWSQEYVSGTVDWTSSNGTAFFQDNSYNNNITMLITPAFDLSSAPNLILSFKHSQADWAGDQDELRVYYRTSMSSNWVLLQAYTSSITSMTLEEIAIPAAAMSTSCQFAFEATGGYGYGIYLDDVIIKLAPTCGKPTINVTDLTLTITPDEVGTPAFYEVVVTDGEQAQTATVTTTTVDLSAEFTLASSTTYQVSVRSNCGGEDYSDWSTSANFTTPCLPMALPYEEDFNSYTTNISTGTSAPTGYPTHAMPMCWNFLNMSSSTSTYPQMFLSSSSTYAVSGNCLFFKSSSATPAYAVLPKLTEDIQNMVINFTYRNEGTGASNGTLYLGYMTDPTNSSTFVPAYTCPQTTTKTAVEYAFNQAGVTGSNYYIAFRYTGGSYNNYYASIDNVMVTELPSCPKPTAITVDTVTETTAQVSWTAGGSETEWEVSYTVNDETVTETTNDNPYTITGLSASTYYVIPFSVKAICSATDESEVTSTELSFNTVCNVMDLPLVEDFESNVFPPTCWTRYKVSGPGNNEWNTTTTHHNGSRGAYIPDQSATTLHNLVTPKINVPAAGALLKFWVKRESNYDTKLEEGIKVLYGANEDGTGATELTHIHRNYTLEPVEAAAGWYEYTVVIPEGQHYVIFQGINEYGSSTYMDDISIDVVPTCFVPTLLNVSEVHDYTAVVTWNDNYDQAGYAVEYMAEGDADWTVVTVDTTYALLSNLLPSTNYTVRVKAVCGVGDESVYTDEVEFTTYCIAGVSYTNVGTGSTSTSSYYPVASYYNYSYSQQIFTAEEINAQGGNISSLSIQYSSTTDLTIKNNVRIYLANTDKEVFANTSDAVTEGLQLVYEGALNCTQGWNEVAFNTSFGYNGGNLVVVMEDLSNASTSSYYFNTTSAGTGLYRTLYYYNSSNPFTGTATSRAIYRTNIQFSICPDATDLAITEIKTIADACEVDDAVTISVENLGYEGTVSTFEAYYQVNEETPVHETVTLATPIAMYETASYTFTQLPVFVNGENTLTAWVELEGDAAAANNYITAEPIVVLDPETVPYVEDFAGLTINHGWNPIDANHDGITMDLNNNINYTYNDELAADDWMMSPCIEMPVGTYTISYDYMANSSLTESFEVFYGNGAHIADMTNALAAHTFNNTAWETVTNTIEITEAGVYNFGFHATSLAGNLGFSIDNFKVYPVNDVVVTYAENGTVTPNGTIAVNYGEDLTLNLVPDPMYHVAGVWVDDVQVVPEDGTGANFMLYTLENVTEPHTVFVDFKLEFHIFKSVENYRSDLYSDLGGAFVPAATDTTINPDPFTVTMVADPHYFLTGLTLSPMDPDMQIDVFADVVDNGDGTYNYTIDTLVVANYYLNATFRRDTVAINYNVLTGKGFANDSELMNAGDTYTTWVDYSVNNDVDTTVTFYADENDGYHIVDVIVNGTSMGRIDSYTFTNVTETQNVDLKFGYRIDAFVSNYNTYDSITDIMGTIIPDTQYVAEYNSMWVVGTVEEHFHLYQFLVNGVDRIDEVVFLSDPHYYYFTMDSVAENYTIEAVVKVDTFAITYNVIAGQGYADASGLLVEGESYSTIVNYADDWYSDITPATGYSIYNVDLDGQNLYTASNYQFNYIVESHEFTVSFAPNTYTITTNAYGNGTVSEGAQFIYTPDAPFNYDFTATADEGYYIASITINNEAVDLTGVEDTYTTTIENVADNYTIDVIFQMYTYTMTGGAGFGGNITPSGSQTVNYGTDLLYEIVANEGYYIENIYVDGELVEEYTQADDVTAENVSFTAIDADHEVYATFAEYMYTITGIVGEHGTVNGATTINEELSYGSNYTLTITPDENYQVADVEIDGISMGAITSYEFINVTADHNVVVSFEATMYTLTASTNIASCTITPATTTVQAGSDVIYTVTPATGYHLVSVTANGVEIIVPGNTFTIEDVQGDIEIYAIFASNNVTVTVDQPAHATIAPGTMMYAYGATPSYTIVPEVGYEVVNVTAGNAIVNVTYNNGIGYFTLDALVQDITLTATTAIKTYTITVTQGANGTIAPATQTGVEYGSSRTFTITPNDYYVVADVIVDGSSRGQLSSYTFYNVTGNHTITAVFEANCQTPTNLTAFDIDTTSAVVSWVGNATSYEVRYKTANDADYTTQTVTSTSLALTGLTPNTLYSWGVRAVCGTSMYSDWASNAFTTKALPVEPVVGIANADLSSIKVYSYLNNVYVVNEEGIAISNIDIYDIYGKQVYTGKVINSPEVISLNVANGNYVVRLATDNGIGVYKVAIVR
jgi:hypothetical protein